MTSAGVQSRSRRDDVVFVLPPGGLAPGFREHLGAAFLRAVLENAGIRTSQYRERADTGLRVFARFLEERAPAIVGLTAYETNLRACRALTAVVRATLPDALVVVGGPNATFTPEESLEHLGADVCVRGAGEDTILALVTAALDRKRGDLPGRLDDVPNLAIRTPEGVTHTALTNLSSFPGGRFRALDDLPSPYQRGFIEDASTGVLTARGCNEHCTYCSFATVSARRVHFHSVERVLEDLAALAAIGGRETGSQRRIDVFDDAFTLAPGRARRICEGIIESGLRLRLSCATRVDCVDAELLVLMKRAGFEAVFFGIESAVPRVLRTIGKVQDPHTPLDPELEREHEFLARTREAVAAAKAAGLQVGVSVIGGLPGETADDFRDTLTFVEALAVPAYAHNILAILPGTPLYSARAVHGLEASRDRRTGIWRTRHAYDVDAVEPRAGADVLENREHMARKVSDALCGRPRAGRTREGAAWAVVLHDWEPDTDTSGLRELLAVDGFILVASGRPGVAAIRYDDWLANLERSRLPWGQAVVLSRFGSRAGGGSHRVVGGATGHVFVLGTKWARVAKNLGRAPAGGLRVPVWLASMAGEPPPRDRVDMIATPAPQIADACRWSQSAPRCLSPPVLHAWPNGALTACWGGPALGTVGDSYDAVAARGQALARDRSRGGSDEHCCPLRPRAAPQCRQQVSRLEVASMVAWSLV